jgi:hypothetical protein
MVAQRTHSREVCVPADMTARGLCGLYTTSIVQSSVQHARDTACRPYTDCTCRHGFKDWPRAANCSGSTARAQARMRRPSCGAGMWFHSMQYAC